MNLLHIVEGWGKSTGLLDVTKEERALSVARMKVCAECPHAKKSSILMLLKGKSHDMAAIYCPLCTCPVNEKSLAKEEPCPIGKWENIK